LWYTIPSLTAILGRSTAAVDFDTLRYSTGVLCFDTLRYATGETAGDLPLSI
jgi:hypothetical protein